MNILPYFFKTRLWFCFFTMVILVGLSLSLFALPVGDSDSDRDSDTQQYTATSGHPDESQPSEVDDSGAVSEQSTSRSQHFNGAAAVGSTEKLIEPSKEGHSLNTSVDAREQTHPMGDGLPCFMEGDKSQRSLTEVQSLMPGSLSDLSVIGTGNHNLVDADRVNQVIRELEDENREVEECIQAYKEDNKELLGSLRSFDEGNVHQTDGELSEIGAGAEGIEKFIQAFKEDNKKFSKSLQSFEEGLNNVYKANTESEELVSQLSSINSIYTEINAMLSASAGRYGSDESLTSSSSSVTLSDGSVTPKSLDIEDDHEPPDVSEVCDQPEKPVLKPAQSVYSTRRVPLHAKTVKDIGAEFHHADENLSSTAGSTGREQDPNCAESSDGEENGSSSSSGSCGSSVYVGRKVGRKSEQTIRTLRVEKRHGEGDRCIQQTISGRSEHAVIEQKELNKQLKNRLATLSWNTSQIYDPSHYKHQEQCDVADCCVKSGSASQADSGESFDGLDFDDHPEQNLIQSQNAANEAPEEKKEMPVTFWSVSSPSAGKGKRYVRRRSFSSATSSCASEAASTATSPLFRPVDDNNVPLISTPVSSVLLGDGATNQRYEDQVSGEHAEGLVKLSSVPEEIQSSHEKVLNWLSDSDSEEKGSSEKAVPLSELPDTLSEGGDSFVESVSAGLTQRPKPGINKVSTHLLQNGAIQNQGVYMMESINRHIRGRLSASPSGVATGDLPQANGFWGRYVHGNCRQNAREDLNGFTGRVDGVTFGLDAEINRQWALGAAFSGLKTTLNTKGAAESCRGDHHGVSLYTSWQSGDWFAIGILGYTHGNHDYKPLVNGIRRKLSVNSNTWGLMIGSGYNFPLNGQWALQPKAVLNLVNVDLDDIDINSINTRIKIKSRQFVEFGFGARLSGEISLPRGRLMPEAWLARYNDCGAHTYNITVANPVDIEKRRGMRYRKTRLTAGVGVRCATGVDNNVSVGVEYAGNFMPGNNADTLALNFNYLF